MIAGAIPSTRTPQGTFMCPRALPALHMIKERRGNAGLNAAAFNGTNTLFPSRSIHYIMKIVLDASPQRAYCTGTGGKT